MKIYISIPITGQEATYEQRIDAAVEYVKKMYPKYDIIITPKEVEERLEEMMPMKPKFKDYMLAHMEAITNCDAIFKCAGWYDSSVCFAEHAFADAIGLTILYK